MNKQAPHGPGAAAQGARLPVTALYNPSQHLSYLTVATQLWRRPFDYDATKHSKSNTVHPFITVHNTRVSYNKARENIYDLTYARFVVLHGLFH